MEVVGDFFLKNGVKLSKTLQNVTEEGYRSFSKELKKAMTEPNAIVNFGDLFLKGSEIAAANVFTKKQ